MDDNDLKIGDRVRLTPLGEQRNVRLRNRTGVIRGRTRGNGYYVLMDGNRTVSTLHGSYIEADVTLAGPDALPEETEAFPKPATIVA
jgi:hypothetical protein